ncbi:MAG: ADP-ribosylation factor-like protein [Candidatus Hermodarchaeota archaeon]
MYQITAICPACKKENIVSLDEKLLDKPVGGLYRVSIQHNCNDKPYTLTLYLDKDFKVRQQLYTPLVQAQQAFTSQIKDIVMCGLNNAGKTSIALRLQSANFEPPAPTQLYNIELLSTPLFELSVIDLGGQSAFRRYWSQFVANSSLVLWVIDQTDTSRFDESITEYRKILNVIPSDGSVPLVALLNKSDVPTSDEITEQGVVKHIIRSLPQNTKWAVFQTSAKTGEGLPQVFQWIQENLFGYSRSDPLTMHEIMFLTHLGKATRFHSNSLTDAQLIDYKLAIQTLSESILQHKLSDLFMNAENLLSRLCYGIKSLADQNKANNFVHYLFRSYLSSKNDEILLKFEDILSSFQEFGFS